VDIPIHTVTTAPENVASRHDRKWGLTPLESLLAGMVAGTVSVICTYPLDLARAQLAVLKKTSTSNQGFVGVLKENYGRGGMAGLFRGISPTLLGILPYSGIAFALNEQGKQEVRC
jgi:solute carrier family 25, member 42